MEKLKPVKGAPTKAGWYWIKLTGESEYFAVEISLYKGKVTILEDSVSEDRVIESHAEIPKVEDEPKPVHSPLPWSIVTEKNSFYGILDADGDWVQKAQQPIGKVNARLIVAAVYCFYDVIAWMKESNVVQSKEVYEAFFRKVVDHVRNYEKEVRAA